MVSNSMDRVLVFVVALSGSGHHGITPVLDKIMQGFQTSQCHLTFSMHWGRRRFGLLPSDLAETMNQTFAEKLSSSCPRQTLLYECSFPAGMMYDRKDICGTDDVHPNTTVPNLLDPREAVKHLLHKPRALIPVNFNELAAELHRTYGIHTKIVFLERDFASTVMSHIEHDHSFQCHVAMQAAYLAAIAHLLQKQRCKNVVHWEAAEVNARLLADAPETMHRVQASVGKLLGVPHGSRTKDGSSVASHWSRFHPDRGLSSHATSLIASNDVNSSDLVYLLNATTLYSPYWRPYCADTLRATPTPSSGGWKLRRGRIPSVLDAHVT